MNPKAGKTTLRGYGYPHQRRRKREARRVERGEVFCAAPRCKHPRGRWIAPGEPWDEGHSPFDRTEYLGPMHRGCNRDTRLERSLRWPGIVRAPIEAQL